MALVLDATSWPRWQPEIVATEGPSRVSPGDVVHGHARMLGFHVAGHSTAARVAERAFEEDVVVGVRLRVRYEVTPDGDGTVVTHRLTSDLPRGILGYILSFFLRWRLRAMQRAALRELVAQSEASCS